MGRSYGLGGRGRSRAQEGAALPPARPSCARASIRRCGAAAPAARESTRCFAWRNSLDPEKTRGIAELVLGCTSSYLGSAFPARRGARLAEKDSLQDVEGCVRRPPLNVGRRRTEAETQRAKVGHVPTESRNI